MAYVPCHALVDGAMTRMRSQPMEIETCEATARPGSARPHVAPQHCERAMRLAYRTQEQRYQSQTTLAVCAPAEAE